LGKTYQRIEYRLISLAKEMNPGTLAHYRYMQSMAYMKRYAPPAAPAPAGAYQDDEPLPDDEPLGRLPAAQTQAPPPPATNGGLVLKTECEFLALGRSASWDKFAVLVHAKAPTDVARSPLDLVTVLDVSGSMQGQKIELLKRAMCFVVDQLGPDDRLSMVSFSGEATRLTPLTRMTDAGKASTKVAVGNIDRRPMDGHQHW
jgi:hypothetical protein